MSTRSDSLPFSVIGSVRHVRDSYRRFVLSTYRLANPKLREQFERHVNEADVLVKGPYVTLARDFVPGERLPDLIAAGTAHADLGRLNWSFGSNPLYKHQERALRVATEGRNLAVKTGTGSGKTESFLLPVLSGVARLREEGVRGVKAILLYPMNALANDQLLRLRELIRDSGTGFTFALYTGDSDSVVKNLAGEPVEGLELTSRAAIRRNPPDILLTNYKQLEFLLIRKEDRPIFTPALRYLVLDEIHTYRGALATEIACLVRRLKARCQLRPGALRCLATSATVSQDAGGDTALADFLSGLFGETFDAKDVIGEIVLPVPPPASPYSPPIVEVSETDLESAVDGAAILALAETLCGRTAPGVGPVAERIAALLKDNEITAWLNESTAGQPLSLEELAESIVAAFPPTAALDPAARQRLLEAYLLVGSAGAEESPPLLRPKLHTFFHGVYDVGLCLNPACRELVQDGSEACPKCGCAVRPAVLCRTCGQDFVKVKFEDASSVQSLPNDDFASDELTAFITPELIGEEQEEEDPENEGDEDEEPAPPPKRGRKTAPKTRSWAPEWVNHQNGKVHRDKPESTPGLSLQHVLRGKGNTCPVCRSTSPRGDILTLLRTGAASTTSVLATHHLDKLPDERRRLLAFADNRQDAAHQAGYMTGKHRDFALRHALARIVRDSGKDGIALNQLAFPLLETFQSMGLAGKRLSGGERKLWLKTLEYEAAGEFCRSGLQRVSLENLAIVEVQYEGIEHLIRESEFVAACRIAGISVESGAVLVRALLDHVRRRRAVAFDFYQSYLNPTTMPWMQLTHEPYSIVFPERELGPVFFMRERGEAARNRPGGTTFHSFFKDTDRGGPGILPKLVSQRAGLGPRAKDWIDAMLKLLASREILVAAKPANPKAREAMGRESAWQIDPRFIRLHPANEGWRCQKCQTWRPYQGLNCYGSSRCQGDRNDLLPTGVCVDHYYERLYLDQAPRRLKAREHTAQISQDDRARLETEFKEGKVDVLVCSPTLELGVNIGTLDTVLLRNCPPMPANYVQRAGRAGREHRIGFVSTFCGVGPHDRHCFDDPPWLVRGEFRPPRVKLDNLRIVARHVRSLVLEQLDSDLPSKLEHLLDDVHQPSRWESSLVAPVILEIGAKQESLASLAMTVFAGAGPRGSRFDALKIVATFGHDLNRTFETWFATVKRLFEEWEKYRRILADRYAQQKARARERAYRELTQDEQKAHILSYLADMGLLPSYQFPTDTFRLDPGVGDTPTLQRPAWIALFEFAPGNLVYANGHKLKSIRAFFEGSKSSPGSAGEKGGGGRIQRFFFCESCGAATSETSNACPQCGSEPRKQAEIALIESYEAEENTQISAGEENRERMSFERKENLVHAPGATARVHPYEFAHLELRPASSLLVTNWGKRARQAGLPGEGFQLCSTCGRHKSQGLTQKRDRKWDEEHAKWCNGNVERFVLGYQFEADTLLLPIVGEWLDRDKPEPFLRTLGSALVQGAVELLELEPDEVAYFFQGSPESGWCLAFYETVPGGAGYLESLAASLPQWARHAESLLFEHECAGACYRCLKTYRNQFYHRLLDKNLVRDILFHFANGKSSGPPRDSEIGMAARDSADQIKSLALEQISLKSGPESPIERRLLQAMKAGGVPTPCCQFSFRDEAGQLITVADFAYPEHKLAIFCDGFAWHGTSEKLASDAQKRNFLQARGWRVLTFWGRTILSQPTRCVEQIRAFLSSAL